MSQNDLLLSHSATCPPPTPRLTFHHLVLKVLTEEDGLVVDFDSFFAQFELFEDEEEELVEVVVVESHRSHVLGRQIQPLAFRYRVFHQSLEQRQESLACWKGKALWSKMEKHRQNSQSIIHCPTSEGVSEVSEQANE